MKISKPWLDKFFDAPLPDADALSDALTFHAFEIDGVDRVGDDDVLDVKVTPNRGHDCLSHRGIAKELSTILKLPLAHDPFGTKPAQNFSIGSAEPGQSSASASALSVGIQTPLCKRYMAAYIKGVKVGPSPKWLQERLEAIGQRSINNVVDATNFVMFNTGQPLHAFDANRLGSLNIGVRMAQEGEKLEALDKKVYDLTPAMLVITANDRPVGIAGIKGGEADRIDETTVDVVIESANFDGVTIRKGSQALKLRTDASSRFEQVLSPELCVYGMNGMLEFIAHVCGGDVVSLVDVYPEPQKQTYVSVTLEHINKLLGTKITAADVADVFTRLGFAYKEEQGVFEVQPPAERLDLVIAEDLIEEVGRIIGYDNVPAVEMPALSKAPDVNAGFYAAEKTREELIAQGYSEVFTSVFAEKGERTVLNKVDGVKPNLRTNLKDGLLDAWNKNTPNRELLGLKELKLFEIGTVWANGGEEMHIATVNAKGAVEEKKLEPIAADAYDVLPLSDAERYETFSRYPYIVRDVAFWTPAGTDEAEVEKLITEKAGELCVRISQFDRFQKGDKTSLAYRLIFQSFERTLEDAEANTAMEQVYASLKEKGFEIR